MKININITIDDRFVNFFKAALKKKRTLAAAFILMLSCIALYASDLDWGDDLQPGDPISVSNLNNRFTMLKDAVNAMEGNKIDAFFSDNGFADFPGGLQIRWGVLTSTLDGQQAFKFAKTFGNGCFSVVINRKISNGDPIMSSNAWTKDSFYIDRDNDIDGTQPFSYMAIGF